MRYACTAFATAADLDEWGTVCGSPSDEEVNAALGEASDLLAVASGHRYNGICTITETYIAKRDRCGRVSHPCGTSGGITLKTPVVAISSVTLNGEAVDLSELKLRNGTDLVRYGDGEVIPWPSEATVVVSYTVGQPPGPIEVQACCELASKLIAGVDPQAITSASSFSGGGVSLSTDTESGPEDGLLAFTRFVAKWNPRKHPVYGAVWSPGDDWDAATYTSLT